MEKLQKLQSVGINVSTMVKGEFYPKEKVLEAQAILDPRFAERLARYENGLINCDPRNNACNDVKAAIAKIRSELGFKPIVMKMHDGGLKVLTDAESVPYLNNQANSGLKKHKQKTEMLFTHIETENLDEKQSKALASHQRRHAFILASSQGARTQALKYQRKGIQLPDTDIE